MSDDADFRTEVVDALVKIQHDARLMPGVIIMNGELLTVDNERRAAERFYDHWFAPLVAEREILITRIREFVPVTES